PPRGTASRGRGSTRTSRPPAALRRGSNSSRGRWGSLARQPGARADGRPRTDGFRVLRYIGRPAIISSETAVDKPGGRGPAKAFVGNSNCGRVPVSSPVDSLSYLERKVLLGPRDRRAPTPEEIVKAGGFKELGEVMTAASWLVSKGLVTMQERVRREYRLAKKAWATKALPERRLLRELRKAHGKAELEALRKRARMTEQEFSIALGWMRKKGWATVEREPSGTVVGVTDRGDAALNEKGRDEEVIARLSKAPLAEEEVDPAVLKDL